MGWTGRKESGASDIFFFVSLFPSVLLIRFVLFVLLKKYVLTPFLPSLFFFPPFSFFSFGIFGSFLFLWEVR